MECELYNKLKWVLVLLLVPAVVTSIELSCSESSRTRDEVIEFKSPQFPNFLNEDLACEVVINLKKDYKLIRVDFVNVTMDGQGVFGETDLPGLCESDMFFFKGFDQWTPPPKCGDLTGYSFLVERNMARLKENKFKIVALMSSRKFRWHIRIKQVTDSKRRRRRHKRSKTNSRVSKSNKASSLETKFLRSHPIELISGRTEAANLTVPWLVSLRQKQIGKDVLVENCPDYESEGLHFCGGTIVNQFFVVTAAHCLYGKSKFSSFEKLDNLKVVVGDTDVCKDNRRDPNYPSFDHDVESVIFYYGHDPQMLFHDIAVIKLKTSITFMSHIAPVSLNGKKESPFLGNLTLGQISGYGKWTNTKKDESYFVHKNFLTKTETYYPYSPQVSYLRILPSLLCGFNNVISFIRHRYFLGSYGWYTKYSELVGDTLCEMVETNKTKGYEGGTPEPGDSGGPLISFHEETDTPQLTGIILKTKPKFLDDDAAHFLFLSIAKYKGWINAVIDSF